MILFPPNWLVDFSVISKQFASGRKTIQEIINEHQKQNRPQYASLDLTRGCFGLGWEIALIADLESEKTVQLRGIEFLIIVSAFRIAESSSVNNEASLGRAAFTVSLKSCP